MDERVESILDYLHERGVIEEVLNEASEGAKAPPPASKRAVLQLPTITVAVEDLQDESNRTCCICLETHCPGGRVKRLPCAHIFHQTCIRQWLGNTCTCPVCRYELETSDAEYELERFYRMVDRKPRIHGYELERMTVSEIQTFFQQNEIRFPDLPGDSPSDQKEVLINIISESDKVDLIPESKPLRRALSDGEIRMRSRQTPKKLNQKPQAGIPQRPHPVNRRSSWHGGQTIQNYQAEQKKEGILQQSAATKRNSMRELKEETKTRKMPPTLGIKKQLSWSKEIKRENEGMHRGIGQRRHSCQGQLGQGQTTQQKAKPRRLSIHTKKLSSYPKNLVEIQDKKKIVLPKTAATNPIEKNNVQQQQAARAARKPVDRRKSTGQTPGPWC